MTDQERTPDGRYIVVNGRQWRASDPGIPPTLRKELVDELMSARRLVRTDPDAARPRVQDAKVALGERGYEWWKDPTPDELTTRIAAATRALLRHRDGSSICPSDVARVVGSPSWREVMPTVRAVAFDLQEQGEVIVTQQGKRVATGARGPLRIARQDVG